MRPVPIPDDVHKGHRRVVVAAPDGDLTNPAIAPVEAIVGLFPGVERSLSVRVVLEDDDLEQLQAGRAIWLTFLGGMPPFSINVGP